MAGRVIERLAAPALVSGVLVAGTIAAWAPPRMQRADAAPPSAKRLVEIYFKAKKPAERESAKAALVGAPAPADGKEFETLRDQVIEELRKRGRKLESKRSEWFDDKTDGWKGLYIPQKGKKGGGLALGLHGGGAGSGDCGSSASQFGGPLSSLDLSAVFPEVLVKTERGWTDPPETEKWVLELLRAARRTWDIDPNRVYVTGHSMGGFGTWTYGAIHADLFAAGAAFAGAPSIYWAPGKQDVEAQAVVDGILPNLYNLPLFVYQSLDDVQVRPAANIKACGELAKLHESDPLGWEYVYEQVDGRGHGFPEKGAGPGLEWMTSHVRDPRPVKVLWQPVREWKTTFYWVRWDDPWLGSVLTARLDKAANRIDVELRAPYGKVGPAADAERAAHLESLSFYVDGRMLDTAREITVVVDGVERCREVPEASLDTLVTSAEEREDPEYVFLRRLRLRPASSR